MKTNKLAAILLVASFALAGCGNNANKDAKPADTSAETKVEEKAEDNKAEENKDEKAEDKKDEKSEDKKDGKAEEEKTEDKKADDNK